MLPLLLGAATAAILVGCNRPEEKSSESNRMLESEPKPFAAPEPTRLLPLQAPLSRPFPTLSSNPAPDHCRSDAPRPERFAIHDPKAELCRLHELLRGGSCQIEDGGLRLLENNTSPALLRYFPSLSEKSDFAAVVRDPIFRKKLAVLEGLQTYLYSGKPCEFDQLGDLMDLMEAYTLYRSALNSPQPLLRQAFAAGRAGCILQRGAVHEEAEHAHKVEGHLLQHHQVHDAIVTPATLALEGFPADTPVSDCLVLR